MTNLFLILQLPILISLSYYLNRKKLYARVANIYIVSFLEGLGTYLIILSLLLEGFIANPVVKIILLLTGFFIIAFTKNNINEGIAEIDIQLETPKNLITIFSSTFLLFYVMLSVFRFQVFYFQVLFALVVVILFNVLGIFLKRWFSKIWDKIDAHNSMFINFSAVYAYVIVFVLLVLVIFVNFPKTSVNKIINLNNSNSYFAYPNGSTDLVNRYKTRKIIDYNMQTDMDIMSYMNQDQDHIFIYVHDALIIYDLLEENIIYSGVFQENIDGIEINLNNEEANETRLQTDCGDKVNCSEYIYPFKYGDVKYKTLNDIVRFDNLNYQHSDIGFYSDGILHLFKDEKINSRVSSHNDRPLLGFGKSRAIVTDIDNSDGTILYLQLEEEGVDLNIKVYKILEKDMDLILPFYSHYQFGMLVFIFIIGFIPVSNYDKHRSEIR